jgi:hypothetical protein
MRALRLALLSNNEPSGSSSNTHNRSAVLAFVRNLARGYYELGFVVDPKHRLRRPALNSAFPVHG